MQVEMIQEGYIVKGTQDPDEAELFLGPWHSRNIARYEVGRYRKVPGQWTTYNLYKGTGPGSFEAVIAYLGNHES